MPRKAAKEDYAQIYLEAAQEHKTLAFELHEARRYVMAHYVAGLAVECILRAYRYRFDPVFDSRHDLQALYSASRFGNIVRPRRKKESARPWQKSCGGGAATTASAPSRPYGDTYVKPTWGKRASSSGKAAASL